MKRLLAVDPGAAHVGWARRTSRGEVACGEVDAPVALEWFEHTVGHVDVVILEDFVLYGGQRGQAQTWQPMLTSEMIGAMKWIAHKHGVPVVLQGADIKKPIRAQLPARGVTQIGNGTHARDAELHLWNWIFQNEHSRRSDRADHYQFNTERNGAR